MDVDGTFSFGAFANRGKFQGTGPGKFHSAIHFPRFKSCLSIAERQSNHAMRNSYDFRSLRERFLLVPILPVLFAMITMVNPGSAADELPFDPAKICRLSVDNIPRSISIRQGSDVWFGYDLEKAIVFKVWQAPGDKPGLISKDFKAQSTGTAWFEEKDGGDWQLKVKGKAVPLSASYLGCTQSKEHFELRWELSHPDGTIKLSERIAMTAATGKARAHRELRAESLQPGVSLVLPPAYRKAWVLTGPDGNPVNSLIDPAWHQLSLP